MIPQPSSCAKRPLFTGLIIQKHKMEHNGYLLELNRTDQRIFEEKLRTYRTSRQLLLQRMKTKENVQKLKTQLFSK